MTHSPEQATKHEIRIEMVGCSCAAVGFPSSSPSLVLMYSTLSTIRCINILQQWRQIQLIIAAHIDTGRPLTRVICYGRGNMPQYGKTEWSPYSTG